MFVKRVYKTCALIPKHYCVTKFQTVGYVFSCTLYISAYGKDVEE